MTDGKLTVERASCRTCKFGFRADEWNLNCRRHPALRGMVMTDNQRPAYNDFSAFPLVSPEEWCGEWTALTGETSAPEGENARDGTLTDALRSVLAHYDQNTCLHETTHRGGVIWTMCDDCEARWADDRGGFKPYVDPPEIANARKILEGSVAAAPASAVEFDVDAANAKYDELAKSPKPFRDDAIDLARWAVATFKPSQSADLTDEEISDIYHDVRDKFSPFTGEDAPEFARRILDAAHFSAPDPERERLRDKVIEELHAARGGFSKKWLFASTALSDALDALTAYDQRGGREGK